MGAIKKSTYGQGAGHLTSSHLVVRLVVVMEVLVKQGTHVTSFHEHGEVLVPPLVHVERPLERDLGGGGGSSGK